MTRAAPWRCLASGLSIAVTLAIGGCSHSRHATETSKLDVPTIATGTLFGVRSMEWSRNICGDGELIAQSIDAIGNEACIPHGGEVYRVRLRNGRDYTGRALPGNIEIAINGHALAADWRIEDKYFVLQQTPTAMRQATGIALYAAVMGGFDARHQCFEGDWMPGRAHVDLRQCPDRDFHVRNLKRCIPVREFLEHHREARL